MKKSILTLVLAIISVIAQAQGFLKAKGKIITDSNGNKVILRGMGLGGWMLQEGYMFKVGNIGQQYQIKARIQDLVGQDATDKFYQQWLEKHTQKADIDSMAAWGFNSIRLPMHYDLYTLSVEKEPIAGKNTWLEKGFAMTDSLLAWCKANKMYLILDLHAAPGGQGNDLAISDRNLSLPSLWDSRENQLKVIELWKKLAERYANEPWIGGYDIINEPNWGFQDSKDFRGTEEKLNLPLRNLMIEITKAIREVDSNHIIIIEGNGFGNNYRGLLPTWDNNMVLSFHKYGNFNTKAAIQNFLNLRDEYNVPLWLGESGENSNNWFTEAIRLVESHDIGWAWWQSKKMGINNPWEIKITPSYQKLLDYWNNKGPKPSKAEAQTSLDELISLIQLPNNRPHADVIDAMFRQVKEQKALAFKTHRIGSSVTIPAVDFDLGGQRIGYYDKDTASYHYTPGVNTQGNRGKVYRNDGVDIQLEDGQYQVFSIENDEWLGYTIEVEKVKKYQINLEVASKEAEGQIEIWSNNQLLSTTKIKPTGNDKNWRWVKAGNILLNKGTQQLRVKFVKGNILFRTIQIH